MTAEFADIGFAKLDISRKQRTGCGEAVYCAGKTREQLAAIMQKFADCGQAVLGTRCSEEQFVFVKAAGLPVEYDAVSKIITLNRKTPSRFMGTVAILTGGTADIPVAEEAARVAEFMGAGVERFYDVGIAGIHRLLSQIEDIRKADVIIAVAGMEGALAGVVAGLVEAPVIAVPTSVGYGASFHGLSALLTMINSCAEGISVVNIDNGYGAAVQACRILRLNKKDEI